MFKPDIIADEKAMVEFFSSHLELFPGATEVLGLSIGRHHQAYIFDPSVVLVEYKLTLKINGETQALTLRGSTDGNGKRLKHYHILTALSALGFHEGQYLVAEPLGYFPEYHLLIYKNISGQSLYDKLQYRREEEWTQKLWDGVNWLVAFHSKLKSVPKIKFDPNEEKQKFEQLIEGLVVKYSERASNLNQIYETIKRCEAEIVDPTKFVLIHGDFHPANLIFTDNPSKVYGIDFNDVMLYDELYDISYFLTQTHQMLQRIGIGKRTDLINDLKKYYLKQRGIEYDERVEKKLNLFRIKTLLHIKAVSPHHLATNIYEEIKNYNC